MGFKCGIIGLPNIGKSTLFNALTASEAASENYPFCTIDPNVGIVDVPDERLQQLESCIPTEKIIPAAMEFVDIAGLVKGAAQGEGLGNKFLSHIRSTDAIAHVCRCFDSSDVTHVEGSVDPIRDIHIINTELIFADHETVKNNLERLQKQLKTQKKEIIATVKMLEALEEHLQGLNPARVFPLDNFLEQFADEVKNAYRDLHLITAKPVVYVCNLSEEEVSGENENAYVKQVKAFAQEEGAGVVEVCGKLEQELVALSPDERDEMLKSYGLESSTLTRLIRKGYEILGLQTYFTAGEKEIRAWTIRVGDSAPQAAGKIHSDFQRGFICAEVYRVEDLLKEQSKSNLKAKGLLRIEGKDYTVIDGDVIEFRFNV